MQALSSQTLVNSAALLRSADASALTKASNVSIKHLLIKCYNKYTRDLCD